MLQGATEETRMKSPEFPRTPQGFGAGLSGRFTQAAFVTIAAQSTSPLTPRHRSFRPVARGSCCRAVGKRTIQSKSLRLDI